MKSINLKSVILIFPAVIISIASCKKPVVTEVKINDFASLSAEFKTPIG